MPDASQTDERRFIRFLNTTALELDTFFVYDTVEYPIPFKNKVLEITKCMWRSFTAKFSNHSIVLQWEAKCLDSF